MSNKTWRLVVSELGGSTPMHEITIEAPNWVSALQKGRGEIGENGGVPPGASCAVAPDGKVTILDPMARKSYVVLPDTAKSFVPKAKSQPPGPRIPADAAPAPAPAAAAAPSGGGGKKVSKKTVAYVSAPTAGGLVDVPVGSIPQPKVPNVAAAPAPAPAPAAEPAPTAAPGSWKPPSPKEVAARSNPPPAMPAEASAVPAAAPAPAPAVAAPAPVPQPAPKAAPRPAVDQPSVSVSAVDLIPHQLLRSRDEDPSPQSPLTYRERAWSVPNGTGHDMAEQLLRELFAQLRTELAGRPMGKLCNLAIFDMTGTPMITLQWKDWRGEPEITRPTASAPPAPMPAPSAPIPVTPSMPAVNRGPQAATPAVDVRGMQPPPVPDPMPLAPAMTPGAAPTPTPMGGTPSRPMRQRSATGDHDERLAKAFEALQDLYFLGTPAEGLDFVLRLLKELLPSEATTACLYDINTDEFRFVALDGPGSEERKGDAVPMNVGLFGAAAPLVGVALRIDNVASDPRFDPGVDGRVGLEPRSAIYLSLHHEGRLLGMLQLLNRVKYPSYSDADGHLLAYVGKGLAEFLFNARLSAGPKRR